MIYVSLFFLSYLLTVLIKKIAIKNSFLDVPNDRSSHTVATPHGGGIAIAVTWFIGISYFYFIDTINSSLYYALLAGIMIAVISYIDDLFDLSAKVRLIIQSLVAVIGIYFLGGLEEINIFIFTIENQILTNIFAFLLVLWFINLYNFLDGIDGYAGSEAIFLAIAGYLLFGGAHFLVLAVSVLGFLVWNWHKAKIFMGDVGSTLLGYNIAIFTIYYSNIESSNLWIWIILFGLFWFDATLTLFRRYKNSEKLSQAHKKHFYQKLVNGGWEHDKVVLLSIVINFILLSIIYMISNILIALIVSLMLLYAVAIFIDNKKVF